MNSYFVSLQQAKKLVGDNVDISIIPTVMVNGDEMVDIRSINAAITSKKIKYDFVRTNIENNRFSFCKSRKINQNGLNVIDLFCGAGGSSSGFKLAGFNLVGALDINVAAARTHEYNFPECKTVVGDITAIPPAEFASMIGYKRVDVVIGSPPCQTFSSLSQGKIKSLGKDIKLDIRNYFYKNYLDYVTYFKPKAFLMENVPGFQTKYKGEIFNDLLTYIRECLPEYEVQHTVLDAKEFSVPQSRRRLFVCGYLRGLDFAFPTSNYEFCGTGKSCVSVSEAFSDLPVITDDWRLDAVPYTTTESNNYQRMMRSGSSIATNNICRVSNPKAKELFSKLLPGQRYTDLSLEQQNEVSLFDTFNSSVIMGRCHRLPLDECAWTVIAHIGMDGYEYIHPTECRTISVREAARLQSFTDDFIFVGNMREQYVQIGNAVPPLLSYAIAANIKKALLK